MPVSGVIFLHKLAAVLESAAKFQSFVTWRSMFCWPQGITTNYFEEKYFAKGFMADGEVV